MSTLNLRIASKEGGVLGVDTGKSNWVADVEYAIGSLRDVEGARVQVEGDSITEIHVLSRSNRAPKHIVRDVQTVLINLLNRTIDYRKVSVAYVNAEATRRTTLNGNPPSDDLPPPQPTPEVERPRAAEPPEPFPQGRTQAATRPEPAARPGRRTAALTGESEPAGFEAAAPGALRIRFGGVNLFVSGPRTQAQVELRWRGLPRLGSASGWSTRATAHRLVAQATLAAVQEFLVDEIALAVQDVAFLRLGKRRAVVVSLSMLIDRQEKLLVGSCVVEQDLPQAVACATLAAMNRLVGGLRPKEPTEYVLRPTSAQ